MRQEEMAERLKREVKENAHRRRGIHTTGDRVSGAETITTQELPSNPVAPIYCPHKANPEVHNDEVEASTIRPQHGTDCPLTCKNARDRISFGRADTIPLMFYLEHLFPFLFPYYRPPLLQGGRAWILEMMMSSPVYIQATLCQSSYFFSLARGVGNHDEVWETVLTQTMDAFGVLRKALQVINGSCITEHLHGAVRILASIMQLQRFEIAVLSFNNCQAHLNAALALFIQLLDSPDAVESAAPSSSFNAVMNRLGPPSCNLPLQSVHIPSAEQVAFHFSSALLVFDDIIASTVLREKPRLHEYHHTLLGDIDCIHPPINLEAVVGCQNWVLLQIGEIAVLGAWKQQCQKEGNLDIMELVHRATAIKDLLSCHLMRLETNPVLIRTEGSSLLDIFTTDHYQESKTLASQCSIVTRVWTHAALIYLFVVVSGWQPANVDVRYHVGRIIELLRVRVSPPALLRTMVWPFSVAGCLAEPALESQFREMVEALQPPRVFGTVRKALEIMENVWSDRGAENAANRDLAACFKSQGDLVLLV
jgi:hypothetical protein